MRSVGNIDQSSETIRRICQKVSRNAAMTDWSRVFGGELFTRTALQKG